jgi:hypothetical protein
MTLSIQLELENGIVVARCTGVLGMKEAQETAPLIWKRQEFAGLPIVWDFREASFDVQPKDVREIAQFILSRQTTPPPRVALVISRDVDYGFSRMFEVFREDASTEVRTFRDIDEALLWARSEQAPAP